MRHLPERALPFLIGMAYIAAVSGCAGNGSDGVTVDLSGPSIRLETGQTRAEIRRDAFRLAVFLADGSLLTREAEGGGLFYEAGDGLHGLGRIADERRVDRGVELEVATNEAATARVTLRFLTARTLEVTFEPPDSGSLAAVGERWESPDDEVIYGLTERLRDSPPVAPGVIDIPNDDVMPQEVGSLDRRGETIEMFVRPTFSLYAPFYQSSRGYGVSVAGTMPGVYDVAHSDERTIRFRFETGTIAENRRLTFDLFAGPGYPVILDEYTALIGRPFVPPDWAFLNWRWRDELPVGETAELDGVEVNAEVVEDVDMFEELGIPAGVYLLDRPVLKGEYGFARFEWDTDRLPNVDRMLSSLRRRGYRILTWSGAWMCGNERGDNGMLARQLGFLAPGPDDPPKCADVGGSNFILDVTTPEARAWFGTRLHDFVRRYDLDGIKLDRGEEHIPSAAGDVWDDGRTGREVHNDYVVLQTDMHKDALEALHPDGDFVLFTRAGYTGVQSDAIVWGGDIPGSETFGIGPGTDLGLRSAIISQQRAAFMGYPIWGSDTGGYYEFKDREVFARWIEFSAFSGIMEIGGKGTHAPWDMPTDPNYDQEMIDIYRRYTRLRAALQRYIVAAARDAGASGMPIVRPLAFLDREDRELQDRWDQYLFGPDLMVAPLWRIGQRSREVYFPAGVWRSFWDEDQRFEGPSEVTVDAPLDVIPVFVRGDAPFPAPPEE